MGVGVKATLMGKGSRITYLYTTGILCLYQVEPILLPLRVYFISTWLSTFTGISRSAGAIGMLCQRNRPETENPTSGGYPEYEIIILLFIH